MRTFVLRFGYPLLQSLHDTSAVKSITIYSGSANSKFQFHLPSGEEKKIRFIIPPTEREFKMIISDENEMKSTNWRLQQEGTVERCPITFKCANQIMTSISLLQIKNMSTRLKSFQSQTTEGELKEFKENLDILFGLLFYNRQPSFPGSFYDHGLIYEEEHGGSIKFLNLPAKEVLLRYCLNHLKMEKIRDWDGPNIQDKFLASNRIFPLKFPLSYIDLAVQKRG